jgi:hypothetical protein
MGCNRRVVDSLAVAMRRIRPRSGLYVNSRGWSEAQPPVWGYPSTILTIVS